MLPEQYPSMFRALPLPCLILDPEFIIREMTNVYLEMTHRNREDIHRKNYFDVFESEPFDPERAAFISDAVRTSLHKVRDELVVDHLPIARYDIPDKEGNIVPHYWTSWSVPLLNDKGELLYILHRVEDITKFIRVVDSIDNMGESLHQLSSVMKLMLERNL